MTDSVGEGFVDLFICVDNIVSSSLLVGVWSLVLGEPVVEVFGADLPVGKEVQEVIGLLKHDVDLLLDIAGLVSTEVLKVHLYRLLCCLQVC
jgi:hypothetical protein